MVSVRKSLCPGFRVLRGTKTIICNHQFCHPGSEYLFAIRKAVELGALSQETVNKAAPTRVVKSEKHGTCPGFCLAEGGQDGSHVEPGVHYDPIAKTPTTFPCTHESCQPELWNRYKMLWLVINGFMDRDIYSYITSAGWGKRLNFLESAGGDTTKFLLNHEKDDKHAYLWEPQFAVNFDKLR
jgi:hypothetical protein